MTNHALFTKSHAQSKINFHFIIFIVEIISLNLHLIARKILLAINLLILKTNMKQLKQNTFKLK